MLNQTLPFIRYINRDSKTARTMNWENHLIKDLQWSNEIINREAKERVAREIAATAKTGDVIGAGSGSTVYLTLFELAK